MDYLEGVLAFAVVMILLATLASGIVEVLVRISALRGLVLARMIERFARHELPKRVAGSLEAFQQSDAGKKLGEDIRGFINSLTQSPLAQESGWLDWLADKAAKWKILGVEKSDVWRANLKRVDSLTAWAFLQRLARTPYGEEILRQGEARALDILTDITRTYERYAAASQELFRKRANTIALVVGVLLGPILNVNAPALIDYLVSNAAARDALIAQIEPARAAYAEQQARTGAALETSSDEATPEEIGEKLQDLETAVQNLASLDLPILYDAYPFAGESRGFWGFLAWLLGVLLGGFLIGLGGPFWFRVFDSLSQVVQLLRGLSGKPREASVDPEAEKNVITGDLRNALGTKEMVELFRVAAGRPKDAGNAGAPGG